MKDAVEIHFVVIAELESDLFDRLVRFHQHSGGGADALLQNVLFGRNAELFGEHVGKIRFVQAHDIAKVRVGYVGIEVPVDIFEYGDKVRGLGRNVPAR